jgi:hypothetical protein
MSVLEQLFPGLRATPHLITSPRTRLYNCIAWAAGDDANWWWPTNAAGDALRYWPVGGPREETLTAFATLDFTECANEFLETDFEKVALFVDARGAPSHAARQLPTGLWTSKLGQWEDIEHELHALKGEIYGAVAMLLKRALRK